MKPRKLSKNFQNILLYSIIPLLISPVSKMRMHLCASYTVYLSDCVAYKSSFIV